MNGDRYPLATAKMIAGELVEILGPSAERIEIAGSIRRGSMFVKDIELVVKPIMMSTPQGLFGDEAPPYSLVGEFLDEMLKSVRIEKRLDDRGRSCWGERHQRALYKGIPVDIFQVIPPSEWGVQMVIRTGPAKYSKWLVTDKFFGGAMPPSLRVSEGALWRVDPADRDKKIEKIHTPEEIDFYKAIGASYVDPSERRAPEGIV